MSGSRLGHAAAKFGIVVLSGVFAFGPPASAACPQDKTAEYIRELNRMSTSAENSIRYLIPQFRDCGQAVIASELDGSPEWLLSMRQQLQAQAASPAGLISTIDTALGNLGKAETSLQKNYDLVLGGIDSMYDKKFPAKCRNERDKIVTNMKSVRPMVPSAIEKLNSFKSCLGV